MIKNKISGRILKKFACISMLIDHVGASCLKLGLGVPYLSILNIQHVETVSSDPEIQRLIILNCILRTIGRLAFPIFAYLLVEGFIYTKNNYKYLIRLILFAIISEPIYDFAFFGKWYYGENQSIYITLSLGLTGMILIKKFEDGALNSKNKKIIYKLSEVIYLLPIPLILYTAEMIKCDYKSTGVLLILSIYIFRKINLAKILSIIYFTSSQFPATFALIPLSLYNGERGKYKKLEYYGFYLFYPIHLLALGIITNFIILQ